MTNESKITIAKNKKLESDLKTERKENERLRRQVDANRELEEMRKRLGAKGGIGQFWDDDRLIVKGGVRDGMGEEELKKVARAISLGQKQVNLKEREFLAFLRKENRNNLEKFWSLFNCEVDEAGWTIKYKGEWHKMEGSEEESDEEDWQDNEWWYYLWIGNKSKN